MDMQSLLIMVLIVLLIIYLINRIQSQGTGGNSLGDGSERPIYDDPNIEGHGGFGRDRGSSSSIPANEPRPRIDSENIRGHGSFGRDKR
jgi:hypothetical protein